MPDDALSVEARTLRVGGVVPFTTTDFPGRLAAVVFAQGCPWRCGYCHNPHLMAPQRDGGAHAPSWPAVLRWLETRRGLLDGVVFSGGEPTSQAALDAALRDVRSLGFDVGLHTGGAYPRRLSGLLPHVDWVGLDVKAPRLAYAVITGIRGSGDEAFASLDLLLAAGVEHEIRTTVHPSLTPPQALRALARELAARGVARWVLQRFRPVGCADGDVIAAAPRGAAIDESLVAQLREHVAAIEIR